MRTPRPRLRRMESLGEGLWYGAWVLMPEASGPRWGGRRLGAQSITVWVFWKEEPLQAEALDNGGGPPGSKGSLGVVGRSRSFSSSLAVVMTRRSDRASQSPDKDRPGWLEAAGEGICHVDPETTGVVSAGMEEVVMNTNGQLLPLQGSVSMSGGPLLGQAPDSLPPKRAPFPAAMRGKYGPHTSRSQAFHLAFIGLDSSRWRPHFIALPTQVGFLGLPAGRGQGALSKPAPPPEEGGACPSGTQRRARPGATGASALLCLSQTGTCQDTKH